jgi:valyl-tRNA synthetase
MEKRYLHAQVEAELQQLWQQEQVYKRQHNDGPLYSIDTPPPTISGSLHIGHIFSYTQTDIIARYKRMSGFSVFYPFGFDDNGLPTERYVEKKRDIVAHSMSRTDFIALCLQETYEAEERFKSLWKRMGLSADWDACYSTISERARKISQESFIHLFKKGYVYRKLEPALYCTTCQTSVAQAELDDSQKPSHFNDIIFTLEDGTSLTIGTTRPELLPSCGAVLYHPADERYVHLINKKITVPLFGQSVPCIADELVDPNKGTGLVMCCAYGDKNDIYWIKKHAITVQESVDRRGRWKDFTGFLSGLKVHDARSAVLEKLRSAGLLIQQKELMHSVNVHERCKKEIEYLALSQWFVKILDNKQELLAQADKIVWYPAYMKVRYQNWVENLSWDWGISRQRFFGIPFPVWHCKACGTILLADIATLPIDPQEVGFPGGQCPHCCSTDIEPDTDVMDTWNTSSLTPYICASYLDQKLDLFDEDTATSFLPMSMRPQAHDIIRTWAFDTIVKTFMHQGVVPWNDIVISGHVLSDGKEKLSKSKENAKFSPENLLDTYSADVIRYWTASGNLGQDISFSEQQLKIGERLVTKLWNAYRFIDEHVQHKVDRPEKLGAVNEWILHQCSQASRDYHKELTQYEFHHALGAVERFFWQDFCDNYLELIKDQLFNPSHYPKQEIEGTYWTLEKVGLYLLQMFAPFTPYITEQLYQLIYKKFYGINSLHRMRFTDEMKSYYFEQSCEAIHAVLTVVNDVRKLKTAHQLSLKTEIDFLIIIVDNKAIIDTLHGNSAILKGIARAKEITFEQKGAADSNVVKEGSVIRVSIVYEKNRSESERKG